MPEFPVDTADLEVLFAEATEGRYGVRLAFLDKDRAQRAADRLSPSYVLHGSRESLHLIYLVSGADGEIAKALVADLQTEDDAEAFAEFDLIGPDDTDFRLHDDDATHLANGGTFRSTRSRRLRLRSSRMPLSLAQSRKFTTTLKSATVQSILSS